MSTRKQIKSLQEKMLKSISAEDKAMIENIANHYGQLKELTSTLSTDAKMIVSMFEISIVGNKKGSLLDVDMHEIVLRQYLDVLDSNE